MNRPGRAGSGLVRPPRPVREPRHLHRLHGVREVVPGRLRRDPDGALRDGDEGARDVRDGELLRRAPREEDRRLTARRVVFFASLNFPRSRALLRERLEGSGLELKIVDPERPLEEQVGDAVAIVPSVARISVCAPGR